MVHNGEKLLSLVCAETVNEEARRVFSANRVFQSSKALLISNRPNGDLSIVRANQDVEQRCCQLPPKTRKAWSEPNVRLFTLTKHKTLPSQASQGPSNPCTCQRTCSRRYSSYPSYLAKSSKCLSGWDEHREEPAPSSDDAPLKLGRICSLWRQITLSTPVLWDRIHFQIYKHANRRRIANVGAKAARKAQVFFGKVGLSSKSRFGCGI